jgi:hypothetical protein
MKSPQAELDSTCHLLVRNQRLLATFRTQIACSRRLLNPWRSISGGSSDDVLDGRESNLYHRVRARLQQHTLPPAPKLVLAGRSTVQRVCVVCRRRIQPGSIQHEFVAADGRKD